MAAPGRVLIADDDSMVREALAALIGDEPGLQLVGVAGDATDLVAQTATLLPDIVVVDGRMPGGGGGAAVARIRARWPEMLVIAMTAHDDDETRAAFAGCDAYVVKGAGGPSILDIIVGLWARAG